jgi:polyphenol oxidase
VHGTAVLTIDAQTDFDARPEADALVTARPGIALGILTADCVPVLLADAEAGVIGAAHAGWRGAVDGVLARTVEAMIALGASAGTISAAIGPSIAPESYEVGEDFAAMIVRDYPDAVPFIVAGRGKPHFDVPGLVVSQAKALGLYSIEAVGGDSYADPGRYFSHRFGTHHGVRMGRQISLVALG